MIWLLAPFVIIAAALIYVFWTGLLINYRPRVK